MSLEVDAYGVPKVFRDSWSKFTPRTQKEICKLNQSFAWMWMSFLNRTGLHSGSPDEFNPIDELIEPLEKDYVSYKMKYKPLDGESPKFEFMEFIKNAKKLERKGHLVKKHFPD